jgi:predicted restriction endonuclease
MRIKSRKTLKFFRERACEICGFPKSDPAHIRSVGAGGDDTGDNLLSLCRLHHRLQHNHSWEWMISHFPILEQILKDKGWELVTEFGRKRLKRI